MLVQILLLHLAAIASPGPNMFGTTVPPGTSPGLRAAAVALIFFNALLWRGLLALGLSTPGARGVYVRSRRWIDRAAGAVMATLGLLPAADLR